LCGGLGSSNAFSGAGKAVTRTFTSTGGMCPRCEGRGTVSDIDLTQLFDESKSLAEGAITIPGYKTDSLHRHADPIPGIRSTHEQLGRFR
jgi:excinuclease UvrABC ATPase subunit